MESVLSIYVELGIPAMLGTLLVLNRALDFRERLEVRRARLRRQESRNSEFRDL
jgi:hypothetical protein